MTVKNFRHTEPESTEFMKQVPTERKSIQGCDRKYRR